MGIRKKQKSGRSRGWKIPVRQYRQMLTTMQTFKAIKRPRRAIRKAALSAFNQMSVVPINVRHEIGSLIAQSLSKH